MYVYDPSNKNAERDCYSRGSIFPTNRMRYWWCNADWPWERRVAFLMTLWLMKHCPESGRSTTRCPVHSAWQWSAHRSLLLMPSVCVGRDIKADKHKKCVCGVGCREVSLRCSKSGVLYTYTVIPRAYKRRGHATMNISKFKRGRMNVKC